MARKSAFSMLPLAMQEKLDARIRASMYSDLDAHIVWLTQEGCKVSRSALHRHASALRRADSSLGDARARVAEWHARPKRDRDELLMELGQLQLAQAEILAQLRCMGDDVVPPDSADSLLTVIPIRFAKSGRKLGFGHLTCKIG